MRRDHVRAVPEAATDESPDPPLRTGRGIRRGGEQYERIHRALARAALVEIAIHGYSNFAMDDTAVRAGVSVRTAYRHFPTKLDMALAAITQMPSFAGWGDGDDDTVQRVRRMIDIGSALHPYYAEILATAIVHREDHPELLETLRDKVLRPREAVLDEFIDEGIRRGHLRSDLTPAGVHALINGLLMQEAAGLLDAPTPAERSDLLLSLLWPMVASEDHVNDLPSHVDRSGSGPTDD